MALFALFKAQAGFPSPAEDYLEPPLSLDEHLIDNPPATFFVRVAGSSMQGLECAMKIFKIDFGSLEGSPKKRWDESILLQKI